MLAELAARAGDVAGGRGAVRAGRGGVRRRRAAVVRGGVRGPAGRARPPPRRLGGGRAGAAGGPGARRAASGGGGAGPAAPAARRGRSAARDQVEEAAEHALEAAHWADEAGEGPTLGAWARHQLGGFLLRQGRWAEAAEVLESALPDLTAETHGDGAVVQTQWWLGDCLSELGEHRGGRRTLAAGRRDRPALARAAGPRDARPSRRRVPRPRRAARRGGPGVRARGRSVALAGQRARPGPVPARPRVARAAHGGRAPDGARRVDGGRGPGVRAGAGRGGRRGGAASGSSPNSATPTGSSATCSPARPPRTPRTTRSGRRWRRRWPRWRRRSACSPPSATTPCTAATGAELAAGWLEADLGRPPRRPHARVRCWRRTAPTRTRRRRPAGGGRADCCDGVEQEQGQRGGPGRAGQVLAAHGRDQAAAGDPTLTGPTPPR